LIEAFASGEGVLYTDDPPGIESASPDPDDDNAERVRLLEYALELEVEVVVSRDSDLHAPKASGTGWRSARGVIGIEGPALICCISRGNTQ